MKAIKNTETHTNRTTPNRFMAVSKFLSLRYEITHKKHPDRTVSVRMPARICNQTYEAIRPYSRLLLSGTKVTKK